SRPGSTLDQLIQMEKIAAAANRTRLARICRDEFAVLTQDRITQRQETGLVRNVQSAFHVCTSRVLRTHGHRAHRHPKTTLPGYKAGAIPKHLAYLSHLFSAA